MRRNAELHHIHMENVGSCRSWRPAASRSSCLLRTLSSPLNCFICLARSAHTQSAYNQVGAAIDAKTATPDKPGLFTQVSSAVQKGVQQINQAVVEVSTRAGRSEGAAPRVQVAWYENGVSSE
jgi:hypothetical protein